MLIHPTCFIHPWQISLWFSKDSRWICLAPIATWVTPQKRWRSGVEKTREDIHRIHIWIHLIREFIEICWMQMKNLQQLHLGLPTHQEDCPWFGTVVMVIMMVMIIMMILMFNDAQSLFCFCFISIFCCCWWWRCWWFQKYPVCFRKRTRSIPVSFPRWFRYFRIRIHQQHRFTGNSPRPRSKPWDVRVIVVSWNHPKPLRSLVTEPNGWNSGFRGGMGGGWGEVGVVGTG